MYRGERLKRCYPTPRLTPKYALGPGTTPSSVLQPLCEGPPDYEHMLNDFVPQRRWRNSPTASGWSSRGPVYIPPDVSPEFFIMMEASVYDSSITLSWLEWFATSIRVLGKQLLSYPSLPVMLKEEFATPLDNLHAAMAITIADVNQLNMSMRSSCCQAHDLGAEKTFLSKNDFRSNFLFDEKVPEVIQMLATHVHCILSTKRYFTHVWPALSGRYNHLIAA